MARLATPNPEATVTYRALFLLLAGAATAIVVGALTFGTSIVGRAEAQSQRVEDRVEGRLQRIETKVDRLLERSGGP